MVTDQQPGDHHGDRTRENRHRDDGNIDFLVYDVDGLQIDFARNPILLATGQQWNNRGHLTNFMRQLRSMLEEVASQRGRPLLLAVRIPENIVGCHFDGIDVETWIGENLVDLLVPGCGAAEIDIPAFQRLAAGTHVKVYPSWDPIHPTEGYRIPEVEYWRGLYSKWWALGADGVHVFNLGTVPAVPTGISARQPGSAFNSTDAYSPILREIGDPEVMRFKDKVFFVERRTGMHGKQITGDPENWTTPRHMFFLTCMLAPLPVPLANDGRADTLLTLKVTDDVNTLYQNQGDGWFVDGTYAAGMGSVVRPYLGWAAGFFDYDNDGWLDLFVASYGPSIAEVAAGYLSLDKFEGGVLDEFAQEEYRLAMRRLRDVIPNAAGDAPGMRI